MKIEFEDRFGRFHEIEVWIKKYDITTYRDPRGFLDQEHNIEYEVEGIRPEEGFERAEVIDFAEAWHFDELVEEFQEMKREKEIAFYHYN